VELILRTRPDLAFVDIGLPRLDGYGVAAQVREQLGDKPHPAGGDERLRQEADSPPSLEVGFNAHLVKPADIDAILNVLSPCTTGDVNADHDGIRRRDNGNGHPPHRAGPPALLAPCALRPGRVRHPPARRPGRRGRSDL
jgi:hypothetical protein